MNSYEVNRHPKYDDEPNWYIRRYCFTCKKVTMFTFCGNCGKYFCTGHREMDTEYGDYGSILSQYWIHDGPRGCEN